MLLQANAKLNWTLDVLGRRTDGYHLLDTLMSPISLCDDIEITLSPDISIICENMDLPCDEHNTAYRAVKAYYGLAGMEGGASVRITKRIPPSPGWAGAALTRPPCCAASMRYMVLWTASACSRPRSA